MLKKIKKYKVGVDSEAFAISLVEEPAIESNFIALAEQEPIQILMSDNKRHILYGPALVPDRPIYRRNGGEEFYIEFTAESIEKMAHQFIKNGFQKSMTLDHDTDASEVYVIESWLKEDEYKDKSVALGLEVPVGSWCVGVKVNNLDVWSRVESGELNGFSIEAFINLEDFSKINNSKESDMNLEKLENETPVETPAETTVEVTETTEQPTTETVEVTPQTEETTTEEVETKESDEPTTTETKESENNVQLNELVKNLMSEIEALKNYNMTLKDKLDEMGKQPSAKPVNVTAGNGGDSYSAWREQMEKLL